MKVARLLAVLATCALGACGSVQSGGNDGGGGASGTVGARGGSGGATGIGGACGGQICGVQDICCGPAECPRCMNIPSNLCPTTCGGPGGAAGSTGGGGSSGRGGIGGGSAGRGGSGGGIAGRGGAAGGAAGRGGTGGAGGRRSCQGDGDCQGFKCCGGFCVNSGNDILNCGACGTTCTGDHPYCANGTCQSTWPCSGSPTCSATSTCCGFECCIAGQLCCTVTMGPTVTGCFAPVNGTCPTGCSACICAAPTTPIATPSGNRQIAELRVGDIVYSIDRGALAVVPIKLVHRQPVTGLHRIVELRLAHGATLRISPRHPTADGRQFGDLAAGDVIDGVRVLGARLVDYDQPFTHDILPDSDSGTYFASGTLIGSTLALPPGDHGMSAPPGSARRASIPPHIER